MSLSQLKNVLQEELERRNRAREACIAGIQAQKYGRVYFKTIKNRKYIYANVADVFAERKRLKCIGSVDRFDAKEIETMKEQSEKVKETLSKIRELEEDICLLDRMVNMINRKNE